MDIRDELGDILFCIGKESKIHRIDSQNTILDINYDKFIDQIILLFEKYKTTSLDD